MSRERGNRSAMGDGRQAHQGSPAWTCRPLPPHGRGGVARCSRRGSVVMAVEPKARLCPNPRCGLVYMHSGPCLPEVRTIPCGVARSSSGVTAARCCRSVGHDGPHEDFGGRSWVEGARDGAVLVSGRRGPWYRDDLDRELRLVDIDMPPARPGFLRNVVAHPLLVLCPPVGRWLHERTRP